jgi:cysteinyl-tRNA synthetase
MTRLIPILAIVAIVGAVIAQTPAAQPAQPAQPGQPGQPAAPGQATPAGPGMRGGGFQQMRDMQMKALTALQDDLSKLKTSMETPMPANMQNMSEDERAKMRDKMMAGRDEQQKIVTDMESQLAMLKGRRQMQTDHEQAVAQLQAIQNQAKQENATKTADMIGKMIQEKQSKYDQMMQKMGGPAPQP